MKILVQKNIWQEYSYDKFLYSMTENGIEYQEVGLIPFTHEFTEPVYFNPDYIFGSTRFVYVCRQKGFKTFPGFSARPEFYPTDLYINNGEVMKWGDVKLTSPKFIKPLYVEKFFTGRVFEDQEDLGKAQLSTSFIENENDVLVIVSDPVHIKSEYRFFVLGNDEKSDRNISTASMYKQNGEAKHVRIDDKHSAWYALSNILKAHGMICPGFVIDMALVGEEYKIVELNCIQSSGLYDIDTDRFCKDLRNFYEKQKVCN